MMKKTIYFVLTAFIVVGLIFSGGCSEKTKEPSKTSNSTKNLYKVAVSGGTPVFSYLGKDGNLEGFEIDLMNAIAQEEGFIVKREITSRAARIPSLKSKKIDIIMATMTITEERRKEVDFSTPYFDATLYILVPEESNIRSLDDLRGKSVTCAMATTSDFAVSKFLGKDYDGIKRFKDTSVALMEVANRKADAAVADSGIITQYIRSNPGARLRIVTDSRFPMEYYGMAVRKGDSETLNKINSGLKKIKENGRYEQIRQKWIQN